MKYWQAGRYKIKLDKPIIMGIINLTPDSFSDGGSYSASIKSALKQAKKLLTDGADILDIGGESSRPGSNSVSIDEELNRIIPILKEVITWNIPISVDTRRTQVMQYLLEHNLADIINDIYALQDLGAIELLAKYDQIGICLMHMQGNPKNMQQDPHYENLVEEIKIFLKQRITQCISNNIARDRIIIDLGFGFGKTFEHNIALFKAIPEFLMQLQQQMLIGVSKKTMLGNITSEQDPNNRVIESVIAGIEAYKLGAKIIRVHNVTEHKKAFKVLEKLG